MGFFKKLFGIQDKPKADFLNSSVRTGETRIYSVEEKTVNIDEEVLEIFHKFTKKTTYKSNYKN